MLKRLVAWQKIKSLVLFLLRWRFVVSWIAFKVIHWDVVVLRDYQFPVSMRVYFTSVIVKREIRYWSLL